MNEIGRALSSTLDSNVLFEKIYTEMKRLFDVENFYIGFRDANRDEIRFELDVVNGVREPKHSRPMGNFLTEQMIDTREPVLIRENFVEEVGQVGSAAAAENRMLLRSAAGALRPGHRRDGRLQRSGARV